MVVGYPGERCPTVVFLAPAVKGSTMTCNSSVTHFSSLYFPCDRPPARSPHPLSQILLHDTRCGSDNDVGIEEDALTSPPATLSQTHFTSRRLRSLIADQAKEKSCAPARGERPRQRKGWGVWGSLRLCRLAAVRLGEAAACQ